MARIDELTKNYDNPIVKTAHSTGLYDDTDFDNVDYERCVYKTLFDPQTRWMHKCPSVQKKRKNLKLKHLGAAHMPPCCNHLNDFSDLSVDTLNVCECNGHEGKTCSMEIDGEMHARSCLVNDVNGNKRKLDSKTKLYVGRKPKELTTVYKRECDMSSLTTTAGSFTGYSSSKARSDLFKQEPSVKFSSSPENHDSAVENYNLENLTKDNTGYFEVVSPSDDGVLDDKLQKRLRGKRKYRNGDKSKTNKNLSPIMEQNQVTELKTNIDYKSDYSGFKSNPQPSTSINSDSIRTLTSDVVHPAFYEITPNDGKGTTQKVDVKRVSFLELDKFPIKMNKDSTKKQLCSVIKNQSLATATSFEYITDVKMEDKSLSANISSSDQNRKLSSSTTRILNELLVNPEHEKVIKNVLHCLARRATLRRSLSSTVIEIKGKEKVGVSKRKSSGSIQNVSSSDLDRLHFEKYKASVDVAIKMLEERMTKKIYDAVRNREHRRKRKEERGRYYQDIVSCSSEKGYVKEKSIHTVNDHNEGGNFRLNDSKQCKNHLNSNDSKHNLYDCNYQQRFINNTLAYNVYVTPSKTSPFKKMQNNDIEQSSTTSSPRQSDFNPPRHVDYVEYQSTVSHSTRHGDQNSEVTESLPIEGVSHLEENGLECSTKTEDHTDIENNSAKVSLNNNTLEKREDLVEIKGTPRNQPKDITRTSYTSGFRDVQVWRDHTKKNIGNNKESDLTNEKQDYKKKPNDKPKDQVMEHPRHVRVKPERNEDKLNKKLKVEKSRKLDAYNSDADSDTDLSHKNNSNYYDKQRLPPINESKEGQANISLPKTELLNDYPNMHKVSEDVKLRNIRLESLHTDYYINDHFSRPQNKREFENSSTDSAGFESISHQGNRSVRNQSVDARKLSYLHPCKPVPDRLNKYIYNETGTQNIPPTYDYLNRNNLPEYYCNWCLGCFPDDPRLYYDAHFNRSFPRNYKPRNSTESIPNTGYFDYPSSVYSERIRYTCKRIQSGEMNVISFIVFIILFLGLFQYLQLNIK